MVLKRLVPLVIAIALMLPSAALAQSSSTCQGYNTPALCPSPPSHVPTTSASTLPFTGLEVILVAVIGAGVLGTGLALRRLSR
jgi:hypothetical protein